MAAACGALHLAFNFPSLRHSILRVSLGTGDQCAMLLFSLFLEAGLVEGSSLCSFASGLLIRDSARCVDTFVVGNSHSRESIPVVKQAAEWQTLQPNLSLLLTHHSYFDRGERCET